ncbi:MAG: glycerophosphodiester phosphodiesterase family protein [Pseudomonadota bacterium]
MNNISIFIRITLFILALTGCSQGSNKGTDRAPGPASGAGAVWRIAPAGDLNGFFNCLEDNGLSLISAHRAGRYPGYPENALDTAQYVSAQIPAIYEIDVATSRDGVLFLMHDDRLERTTTGTGLAKEADWSAIKSLKLEDDDGTVTAFNPPTLRAFLRWAKPRTLVQIDFKRSTRYEDVVDLVAKEGMQDRVIYIAYTLAQARKLHQLAPDAMISVSVDTISELNAVTAAGIPADRLLAFTGTRDPKPRLFRFLGQQDVEVIFGTLGGRDALDKEIARTGDNSLYTELSRQGVDILATDRPLEAHAALAAIGRVATDGEAGRAICGISKS